MGYDALSSVPRVEFCLRGSPCFLVVFLDLEWIAGDIGELQPNGAMKIMDRKKNIFKLSQGEYVAVENIESKYLRCPLITSIWVYGNSFESFLVAVVVPDRKALEDWAAEHHLTDDFKSLCQNLKARKYILDELNSVGQKQQLRGFELFKASLLKVHGFLLKKWKEAVLLLLVALTFVLVNV
ncbi:PREDICTED: long chain acyl-CoA synthetase 2-like [Prunus mume]|uniref:Long chain acyl-CoA synthetase 2-like n=1 Tax=Prunus mume TaxID=102107 RepID=A0ABM1LSV5_PRUMU|nr:PREDICTED: long chain acyl-CoA synthetase 2-like [Prunus mume]